MTNFRPDDLRAIADLADHMQNVAPIPRPGEDGKRLPVVLELGDAMGKTAAWVALFPNLDPLISFDGPIQ